MRASDHNSTRVGRRRVRRVCALALALSLCAACARDPQGEARQELQTLSSWAATLRLLADSWREGAVPSRYAAKTAEAAQETLQEEARKIERSCEMCYGSWSQAVLGAHAHNLDSLASELSQAVQKEDRAAAVQLVESLAGEEQSLRDLARKAGAQGR
jgi:hypothetical protein